MSSLEAFREHIRRLVSEGRSDQALTECDGRIAADPQEPMLYRARAYARAQARLLLEAIDDLSIVVDLDPGEPRDYFTRGRYRLMLGDNSGAVADLTKTLDLSRELASEYYVDEAYLYRAEAHLRLRDYDRALEDIRSARTVDDDDVIWTDTRTSKREIREAALRGKNHNEPRG